MVVHHSVRPQHWDSLSNRSHRLSVVPGLIKKYLIFRGSRSFRKSNYLCSPFCLLKTNLNKLLNMDTFLS